MAINALIAEGVKPIGADLPQIANMLQQKRQQDMAYQQQQFQNQMAQEQLNRQNSLLDIQNQQAQLANQKYTDEQMRQNVGTVLAHLDQVKGTPQYDATVQNIINAPQLQQGRAWAQEHGIDVTKLYDSSYIGTARALAGIAPIEPKVLTVAPGATLVKETPGGGMTPAYTAPVKPELVNTESGLIFDKTSGTYKDSTGRTLSSREVAQWESNNAAAKAGAVAKATSGAKAGDQNDPEFQTNVHAWTKSVLNGDATMQQVPMQYRTPVARERDSAPISAYSPTASSRFQMASTRMTQPYRDMAQYKLAADGLPYLERIDAAMKTPGSVSDQDILDSLTKLNTGGNAVTDAQVRLITDGRSFSDAVNVFKNKLKNGGVLSDNQRQQIQTIANAIYANYQKGYQPIYEQATRQLKAAGIPEAFWSMPNLNNLAEQSRAAMRGEVAPISGPSGQSGSSAAPPAGSYRHPSGATVQIISK